MVEQVSNRLNLESNSKVDHRRLTLRPAGMFSNVNEVVEQLRLAELNNYSFSINWEKSCYRDHESTRDPWDYYFEPCFESERGDDKNLPHLPGGVAVACTRSNIITPRLDDGVCNPLLLPKDRYGAHELISRYIIPKEWIAKTVSGFHKDFFREHMVGLHIRGPGRTDGGVPELRRRFGAASAAPLQPFFAQVNEALRLLPEAGIFACSDSSDVITAVQQEYGDRVIVYPAQRSEFGEMHANHNKNTGLEFDKRLLGAEVLCEALLLARTSVFVHGNSNLANFVLCASPTLLHAYIQA